MPRKQTKGVKAAAKSSSKTTTPAVKRVPTQPTELEIKEQINDSPFNVDLTAIKEQSVKAIEALKKHAAEKKTTSLFQDLPTRITLDVSSFKIPTLDSHFFNILLRNSIHPPSADVVLIIKHDKKKDKGGEDYLEPELKASLFKEKLLAEHGIKLREVLTLQQLREEYSTFEAKRAFVQRVDVILVDKPLAKHIPGILGREMYRRKKLPIPVSLLETRDLAKEIEKGLRKTVLNISTRGKTSTIQIGTDELTTEQLVENIEKVSKSLKKKFPGGWPNVAKLALVMNDIPPLVIHFSKGGPQDIVKPIKKIRKLEESEEDEISTQLYKRIKVNRNGIIEVVEVARSDGEEEEDEEEEEVADDN